MLGYNKNLKSFSQSLRTNSTDAEKLLWSKIRKKQLKGYQFYRQKIIGNYIADFYCAKANLVLELDGGQHYTIAGLDNDLKRDTYLKELGLKILRFSDVEVFKQTEGVLNKILQNLP